MKVYMPIAENLSTITCALSAAEDYIEIELQSKSKDARTFRFNRRELMTAIKVVSLYGVKVGIMPMYDSYNTNVYEISVLGNAQCFFFDALGEEYSFESGKFCQLVNLLVGGEK